MDGRDDAAPAENPSLTFGDTGPPKASRYSRVREAARVGRDVAAYLWSQARDRDAPGWPPAWLTLLAVFVAGGLFLLVVAPALVWLGGPLQGGLGWLSGSALTRIVADPVHAYLSEHAGGLPVEAATLWWTWWACVLLLWVLATLGLFGARLGWTALGAATTAMAYAGTPGNARPVAAGITVLWWSMLSILAWRRRPIRIRPVGRWARLTAAGARVAAARPTAETDTDEPAPPTGAAPAWSTAVNDEAERAARIYERLLRRELISEQVHGLSNRRWTASAYDTGHGFAAVDARTGQRVVGTALTADAVPGLLAALSETAGAYPQVTWAVAPPPPLQLLRQSRGMRAPLSEFATFLDESRTERAALTQALLATRDDWDLDRLQEQIAERAHELNRRFPIPRALHIMPQAAHGDDSPGSMTTFDWVDTATVVKGGGAGHWNDFASHRPDTVPTIIRTLMTTDRLDYWIRSIHTEGAGLLLIRVNGPAGPLYEVGGNGTHRTHAMRLLDVPRIARGFGRGNRSRMGASLGPGEERFVMINVREFGARPVDVGG